MGLARLAGQAERQTPLLRRSSIHTEVHFEVVFPDSLRMPGSVATGDPKYAGCEVSVKDTVHGHAIELDRVIDIPAGRVQPGDEYAAFQKFVRDSDALYEHETLIGK
jgi:hypothetical protein